MKKRVAPFLLGCLLLLGVCAARVRAAVPLPKPTVTLTPDSGAGLTASFTVKAIDSEQWSNLVSIDFSVTAGMERCGVWTSVSERRIYLQDGVVSLPLLPGQPASVETPMCRLDGPESTFATSGNTLTLRLALAFKAPLSGLRTIRVHAVNRAGMSTDVLGTWLVGSALAPGPPRLASLRPSDGGGYQGVWKIGLGDSHGFTDISGTQLEVRSTDGKGSCRVYYFWEGDMIALETDDGPRLTSRVGQYGLLETDKCVVDPALVSLSGYDEDLTVSVNVSFRPGFKGQKDILVSAEEKSGARVAATKLGEWTVGPTEQISPTVVVDPGRAAGSQQTFTLSLSDPNGWEDLRTASFGLYGVSPDTGICLVYWVRDQDRLRVYGGGEASAGTPGKLGSDVCELDAGLATVAKAGDTITLRLPIRFKEGKEGVKRIWAWVSDMEMLQSPVVNFGAWSVGSPPAIPTVTSVANAASYNATDVMCPGTIIVLFGAGLGPETPALAQVGPDGRWVSRLGGTRVLIGGMEAPLVYASYWQTSAIVPFAAGSEASTSIEVEYLGVRSDTRFYPFRLTAPGMFTLNTTGGGQAVALNEDGSVNTQDNPAAAGSVVSLWATGTGEADLPVLDGQVITDVRPKPLAPLSVLIDGIYSEVLYSGGSPGMVAGVTRIDVRIPAEVQPRAAEPVVLNAGAVSSQSGVTISVRAR
jgi:uncharacterized protein (TIGR03437 family)